MNIESVVFWLLVIPVGIMVWVFVISFVVILIVGAIKYFKKL